MNAAFLRELAGYLELAAILMAGGIIYLKPGLAPWPLLVAPVFWLARFERHSLTEWRNRLLFGLDGWIILFLVSAGLSLWATYDRTLALTIFGPAGNYKFWLICTAVLIYFAAARLPGHRAVWTVMAGLGFFGALVAVYFILTVDFSTLSVKFPLFNQLGRLIQSVTPRLGTLTAGRMMHPNVAGGLAAMFFAPLLQTALGGWRRLPGRWMQKLTLAGCLVCLPVLALGIVVSSSRGAWIGLAAALAGWFGWWLFGQILTRRGVGGAASLRLRAALLAGLVVMAILTGWFLLWWAGRAAGPQAAEGSLYSRIELLRNSLLLVQAAPFTGTGLGTFPMVYSTYVLLINVPYTSHAHNIFMNILLSQGWPGLLVFIIILLAALALVYRVGLYAKQQWPLAGIVAMLVVSVVHGFVDDPLYGSRAVLIWFIPLGLAACAARCEDVHLAGLFSGRAVRRVALAAGGVLVALLLLFWQEVSASFATNLGMVGQVKNDLAQYNPDGFTENTLDQIRQESDFSGVKEHYARALQLEPGQLAASQRLADLALSLGEYEAALARIEPLWAAGHRDRVTRLLYACALVANGQPQEAFEVVEGLAWAEERLYFEGWYRYYQNEDYRRAADAFRVVLLLNPANEMAKTWLDVIEPQVPGSGGNKLP